MRWGRTAPPVHSERMPRALEARRGPGGASILAAFHDARAHLAPAPQAIKRD